jgi:hypothetical protein
MSACADAPISADPGLSDPSNLSNLSDQSNRSIENAEQTKCDGSVTGLVMPQITAEEAQDTA